MSRVSLLGLAMVCAACASARIASVTVPAATPVNGNGVTRPDRPCTACGTVAPASEVSHAIEERIADLKARGGHCAQYGTVLESSYRSGQITIRPFMWRVGSQLASGEAKPNGEMVLAREIDSLNVGVRTIRDLLWTMEHEAAHIAFKITNGVDASTDRANEYVRACKP